MKEVDVVHRALEARVAHLERQLAAGERGRRRAPHVSRLVAVVGLVLGFLIPGIVVASDRFPDVPNGGFHNDIDWLADYGITTGFNDGTFRPAQPVTRQAMAAFMHRLSNTFEVIESVYDHPAGTSFTHYASCPGDKRPVAGGGETGEADLLIARSYPDSTSWNVRWESDNNVTVDPAWLRVYALCIPRL